MPAQTRNSTLNQLPSNPKPSSTSAKGKDKEVEVRHGSSAQGTEQKGKKGKGKTPTEGVIPDPNPTVLVEEEEEEQEQEQEQVQEQEEQEQGQDQENKNDDMDTQLEVQKQQTKMMNTMLAHMNSLGKQVEKLSKKFREMEERDRNRGYSQRDIPSGSHKSNISTQSRRSFSTNDFDDTRFEKEDTVETVREMGSRRASLSDHESQSKARRPISRARAIRASRVKKTRERSQQKGSSRSRSRGSFDDDSVSAVDSAQLIQILQTFADTQLAANTRFRDNDEKTLSSLTKHRLLADRSEGKEIQWLLNLNMLREQRDWSDKRYCTFLPRLWNPQAKSSVTRFFLNLETAISKNRIELDRAFIEEFATGGIAKLLDTATHASQPEDNTCKEFLENVQFATRALDRWYPEAVPNESYIIETLSQRFTSAEMLKRLAYARKRRRRLSLGALEEMATLADEHDRIERRAGTNRILRINMRRDRGNRAPEHSRSADVSIRAIIDDTRSCVADTYECIEDMLLTMAATETIYTHEGTPTVRAVSKVMDKMQRAPPIAILAASDVKLRGAVCNGPLKHTCKSTHICIWHSLKGICNLPEGKCRHPHVLRKAELCKADKTGSCTQGGYCPYRHSSDQYEVIFYDRRSRKYNKYLWNDRMSPFSVYYKHK